MEQGWQDGWHGLAIHSLTMTILGGNYCYSYFTSENTKRSSEYISLVLLVVKIMTYFNSKWQIEPAFPTTLVTLHNPHSLTVIGLTSHLPKDWGFQEPVSAILPV
jgi:hypothetical protein